MSRSSQTHYAVPGRERKRRSFISRAWFPLLSMIVVAGAVYGGYVYRPVVVEQKPLAHASGALVVPGSLVKQVAPVALPAETKPAATAAPDISAYITRDGLNQNRANTWSVAVYDITNNRWLAQINSNQQLFSASLYKLYVTYGLAKKMSFQDWQSKQVAGHSVKECTDMMLRVSNNPCAIGLGQLVGWNFIDKQADKQGFTGTTMSSATGSMTTATDSAMFMSELYQGKLLDPDTTAFVLNSLKNQQYRSGIPAGCPGCTVYNKTGNDGASNHDVAIVQNGTNTYAVAILSEGASQYKIASIERAIEAALKTIN